MKRYTLRRIRKYSLLVALLSIAFTLLVSPAFAQVPVPEDVSDGGVVPFLITNDRGGNVPCTQLFGEGVIEVKFDYDRGEVPIGSPGGNDQITFLFSTTDHLAEWSSTSVVVQAVILKASDAANVYYYNPPLTNDIPPQLFFGDTNLVTPTKYDNEGNPDGNYGISHISFCYNTYALSAEKTADAEYTRTYTWDITKDFDGTYNGFIGDPAFDHDYKVTATRTDKDSDFKVYGTISVTNPAPYPVPVTLKDEVAPGVLAKITACPFDPDPNTASVSAVVVQPGTTTWCYSANVGSATNGTNTATITSGVPTSVFSTTAQDGYSFGEPTVVGSPSTDVTDNFDGQGEVVIGNASTVGATVFDNIDRKFQCPANPNDYDAEGKWTKTYPNTAKLTATGQSDDASVTLNCYAPVPRKDASTTYTREYDWSITKDFDETYNRFIGDPAFNHEYIVKVTKDVDERDFVVSGKVYVKNYHPTESMTVDVADSVGGNVATIDCGDGDGDTELVVPANGTEESCDYTATLNTKTNGTNSATVTFNGINFPAIAGYTFGEPTNVIGPAEVTVVDTIDGNLVKDFGKVSETTTFETYTRSFECPTEVNAYDINNGTKWRSVVTNIAKINETDATPNDNQNDATVTLNCYLWDVQKDAYGSYQERYEWEITKTVDKPGPLSGFAGDTLTWEWTIDWNKVLVDLTNVGVTGKITITNPAPMDLVVNLSDVVDGGFPGVLEAACQGDITVPNGTKDCQYSANVGTVALGPEEDLIANLPNSNTVTATASNNWVDNDTETILWTDGGDVVPSITEIDDSSTVDIPENAEGMTFSYSETADCSTIGTDYTDGSYPSGEIRNDATIYWDGGSDSDFATTSYNCYLWNVGKSANGGFHDLYKWTITKDVSPESQIGYAGETLTWEWTIKWESEFDKVVYDGVTGTITVTNPAPMPLTVDVTDVLSNNGANPLGASVDCGDGKAILTIAGGQSGTCGYTADPDSQLLNNTATATRNGVSVSKMVNIDWKKGPDDVPTPTIDDTFYTATIPANAPQPFKYKGDHECSTDLAAYTNGSYSSGNITNTATISWNDQSFSDDATTQYTCKAASVDVLKTTNEFVNSTYDWSFALYEGPDGFGGTQVGNTSSTLNDEDGVLDFGDPVPALNPDKTYTVCELEVAAGWATEWSIGGTTVIPYNPNQNDDPPASVGNYCFDIGADTSYPLSVGTTLRISIDNNYPGGAPRTPGYWKNWSSCSGGGQFAKTTPDVDPDNEFVSLDEVLNAPGVTWDDILAPSDDEEKGIEGFTEEGFFVINDCDTAVRILDQRDVKYLDKNANDAAFTLAMHLMAAQLNFGAGACTTPEVLDKALEAETLLDEYDFNGITDGKGKNAGFLTDNKNPDKAYALELADYLDQYNNGAFCGNGND